MNQDPFAGVPVGVSEATLTFGARSVRVTNLEKVFWPEDGLRKRDLLAYYASIAQVLLPHVRARAMVMKRYPNGIAGDFFFMKRTPPGRPTWLTTCSIEHGSGSVIDFPIVDDVAALMWVVNLGCIDLNQWYARCDDVDRPDYVHFDLDPGPEVAFEAVRRAAFIVRDGLAALGLPSYPKTSGSKGIHVYVPIVRGPVQKDVWAFAKALAQSLATLHPDVLTAEYRIKNRPAGRVLVDYNQNAWGRTLACVYSVRPRPGATVSAPVTWQELEAGAEIADFHLTGMAARVTEVGDLWAPLASPEGRADLGPFLTSLAQPRGRKRPGSTSS